jgi:hypothetical protein
MVAIEYIVLACYPPRSATSQDGRLVGLNETQYALYMCFIPLGVCR